MSLPSRERGLKYGLEPVRRIGARNVAPFAGAWIEIARISWIMYGSGVAPFAGAWIEISISADQNRFWRVAPFAGAWIEIAVRQNSAYRRVASLPSRERGLKFNVLREDLASAAVAPFAGAWIEISYDR